MKIYSIEVTTDQGRRGVQFAAPVDVDVLGAMPSQFPIPPQFHSQFSSFPEFLWGLLQQIALNGAELAASAPKAEA